ncbi:MAG: T9SS type A sorting domain-containing protein [Bacteroidales bacterium]|nr:T9SS type A sorting domain-containing protein [Bacteroidales bacterium]
MKNTFSKGKNMITTTNQVARRLMLTLLAVLTTTMSWAQLVGRGTQDDPYLIRSASDWTTFTNNVNGGAGTRAYYKLTADITLGTAENPITTVVGTMNKYFRGYFDGDFHTIHLNMRRTENYAALFGVTDGAKIKNLSVDGTIITDHKFAGAFVGYAKNGQNNSTDLTNCISSIHIICDSIVTIDPAKPFDCTHGGLVGQNESGVTNFVNCIFDGWIKDRKEIKTGNKCTGFIGWANNTVTYTNCTMAGTIDVKPNDDNLKNSMANFHRLAASAKAIFYGPSYYIHDYTYPGLAKQGIAALSASPENTISRKYTFDKTNYYVPAAEIYAYNVSYYGRALVENTDYDMSITHTNGEYKITIQGKNNYAGTNVRIYKDIKIDVKPWDPEKMTGWYAISSSCHDMAFKDVPNLTSAIHNIYRYDETDRMWQEYRNTANDYSAFENGRGYIYRTLDNGGTITFNGTPNIGDVSYTLSMTTDSDDLNGFNLIGNPYAHLIYKGVAIPNDHLANGYCLLNTDGTWQFKTDDVAIPAGTAILVQVKSDRSAINITMKDIEAAPAKRADSDNICFTVKNGQYEDVARVEFSESRGFNKMAHYNEDAPMLYVKYDGENFASASLSDDTKAIDLCFKTKGMSRYTLCMKANGMFDYLHLIDKMTGEDVDLLVENEYSFIGSANDNADRFIVKLSNDAENDDVNEIFAYQNGSDLVVNGEGELQVFDVMGRMIMKMSVNGDSSINGMMQGVYVLRLLGNDVKTQKIVVR